MGQSIWRIFSRNRDGSVRRHSSPPRCSWLNSWAQPSSIGIRPCREARDIAVLSVLVRRGRRAAKGRGVGVCHGGQVIRTGWTLGQMIHRTQLCGDVEDVRYPARGAHLNELCMRGKRRGIGFRHRMAAGIGWFGILHRHYKPCDRLTAVTEVCVQSTAPLFPDACSPAVAAVGEDPPMPSRTVGGAIAIDQATVLSPPDSAEPVEGCRASG